VLAAAGLDALAGDPPDRWHPVSWTGNLVERLERAIYPVASGGSGGTLLVLASLGTVARVTRPFFREGRKIDDLSSFLSGAVAIDAAISLRQLVARATEIRRLLEWGDLERARSRIGEMVGRDTHALTREEVVRATLETLAENASDGVFAPLCYALLGGPRLAYLYRTVNTLDSMVGYRNERYERFGRVPARLDDLANLVPARLTAALLLLGGGVLGKDMLQSVKIILRDAPGHASPNAGWPEAAMAGLLGVGLGGTNHYAGVPHRGATLGDPVKPLVPEVVGEAVRILVSAYVIFLAGVAAAALAGRGRRA
jgi:adenosylcobinamide-phosphate synthase